VFRILLLSQRLFTKVRLTKQSLYDIDCLSSKAVIFWHKSMCPLNQFQNNFTDYDSSSDQLGVGETGFLKVSDFFD